MIPVTITYLEMHSPAELRPKPALRPDLAFARVPFPMPELNRFFYTVVGKNWRWYERLVWTDGQWLKYVDRPELQTWVISENGIPAGYVELEKQPGDDVEIVYFGLLWQFLERGIGGWAISEAVVRAWGMGATRVWLHTCDLDHPRALANYLARGFKTYKSETKMEDLPV